MLFGTGVPPIACVLATPAFLPLLPGQQLGRPQPHGQRGRGDQRLDDFPVTLAVAERPDSDRKG